MNNYSKPSSNTGQCSSDFVPIAHRSQVSLNCCLPVGRTSGYSIVRGSSNVVLHSDFQLVLKVGVTFALA